MVIRLISVQSFDLLAPSTHGRGCKDPSVGTSERANARQSQPMTAGALTLCATRQQSEETTWTDDFIGVRGVSRTTR